MDWKVNYIADWIMRMGNKYGHVVFGKGKRLDWGQALCIEMYGDNPMDWPDIPEVADITEAAKWEVGEFPEWLNTQRGERKDGE